MITTQVIDIANGAPVPQMAVELDLFITGHGWHQVGYGVTDGDGAVLDFGEPTEKGLYRLMYDVASYNADAFFPSIAVTFEVRQLETEVHIPLTLSPFGYSVHRGF